MTNPRFPGESGVILVFAQGALQRLPYERWFHQGKNQEGPKSERKGKEGKDRVGTNRHLVA